MQQHMNGGSRGRFSHDLTATDFSSHMQSVRATGGLNITFDRVKVKVKSRNADRAGEVQTRLVVMKQPRGERLSVAKRYISEEQAMRDFPVEYEHYTNTSEVPTTGTPLEELPGISRSQIGLLIINGLNCVEDLCDISEDQAAQIGLDASKARKVAIKWSENMLAAAGSLDLAEIEAKFERQRQTQNAAMEDAQQTIAALTAQVTALSNLSGNAGSGVAASAPAMPGDGQVQAVEPKDDFPDNFDDMPNPMAEGPATTDGFDDLGTVDADPLAME